MVKIDASLVGTGHCVISMQAECYLRITKLWRSCKSSILEVGGLFRMLVTDSSVATVYGWVCCFKIIKKQTLLVSGLYKHKYIFTLARWLVLVLRIVRDTARVGIDPLAVELASLFRFVLSVACLKIKCNKCI